MREVVVLGVGMTQFGKHPDKGIKELGEEGAYKAMKDAGVRPKDIQAAYCGYMLGRLSGQEASPGHIALNQVGIRGIPITRVENGCASGSFAFREAWIGIASGLYDVAMAIGIEKMTGAPTQETLKAMAGGSDSELEGIYGITFPGIFAMIARRHMEQYGTKREQLAMVSVKNHSNGCLNPYAQYKEEYTIEDVLNSRSIARPLNLLDCCPISDGCACVILASKEAARRFSSKPIDIVASAHTTGTYDDDKEITSFEATRRGAKQAYEMAGLGPQDIDVAEVHDCFTIAEIIHYEDLSFCKKGEGGPFVEAGHSQIGGKTPVNPSGGLLSKGHPIGATGLAQIVEIVEQLRGQCGPRQVQDAKVGMAHCLGGFMHGDVCNAAIHIFKR